MKNVTLNIANEMTNQINNDAIILGVDSLNANWFNMMLEVVCEKRGISFENEQAKNFFNQAVIQQIDREAYSKVFAECGMNSKGEYTTNSKEWV